MIVRHCLPFTFLAVGVLFLVAVSWNSFVTAYHHDNHHEQQQQGNNVGGGGLRHPSTNHQSRTSSSSSRVLRTEEGRGGKMYGATRIDPVNGRVIDSTTTTTTTKTESSAGSLVPPSCQTEELLVEQCIGSTTDIRQMYDCKICVNRLTSYLEARACNTRVNEFACIELQACASMCSSSGSSSCDSEVTVWGTCKINTARSTVRSNDDPSSCPEMNCMNGVSTPPPPGSSPGSNSVASTTNGQLVVDSTLVIASQPAPTTPAPVTTTNDDNNNSDGNNNGVESTNNGLVVDSSLEIASQPTSTSPPTPVPTEAPAPVTPAPVVEVSDSMMNDPLIVDSTLVIGTPQSPSSTTPIPTPTITTTSPTSSAPILDMSGSMILPTPDSRLDGVEYGKPSLPPAFSTTLVGNSECTTQRFIVEQCLFTSMQLSMERSELCIRCILTASSTPLVTDETIPCSTSNGAACGGLQGCSTCSTAGGVVGSISICWTDIVNYASCEAEYLRRETSGGNILDCPYVNTTCPTI